MAGTSFAVLTMYWEHPCCCCSRSHLWFLLVGSCSLATAVMYNVENPPKKFMLSIFPHQLEK
jgi:hypothetical protein